MGPIRELLHTLETLAKAKNYSRPWIVGGVPRDKLIGIAQEIEDLDITSGDNTIHALAMEFSDHLRRLGKTPNYKQLPDGHAQVVVDGLKFDFSSNYRAPGIQGILQKAGAKPTDMLMELMSRDFTCNTLLMSSDLATINDPTGLAIKDIKAKLLRTALPAKMTLANDNKRVVRILYLAAKLGFTVDKEIVDWVKANPQTIANVKQQYLSNRLQKAINYDEKKTVQLLNEMGLWHYVPPLPSLMPYMTRRPDVI